MPEGYTHVRTARKAAAGIHYKLHRSAAFAAGANGPDVFFTFEVWKPARKRRFDLPALGNRMHDEATGAFLLSLLRHVKTAAQVEYALGFLSHYAADTTLHPYVVAMCRPGMPYAGKGGHGYFEIALDSTLHAEDTGVSGVPGVSLPAAGRQPPNTAASIAAVRRREICRLFRAIIPRLLSSVVCLRECPVFSTCRPFPPGENLPVFRPAIPRCRGFFPGEIPLGFVLFQVHYTI